MSKHYDPSQPRVPSGHVDGGQWTNSSTWSPKAEVAGAAARRAAGLAPERINYENVTETGKWGTYRGDVYTCKPDMLHRTLAARNLLDLDEFEVRGIIADYDGWDGNFPMVGIYYIDEKSIKAFNRYYDKIMKIFKLDINATEIYVTNDLATFRLFKPWEFNYD